MIFMIRTPDTVFELDCQRSTDKEYKVVLKQKERSYSGVKCRLLGF